MTRAARLWMQGSLCASSELASAASEAEAARLLALIAEHFDFIFRLLRRLGLSPADAEDAAQQVFMIATQKLSAIEPQTARSFLYGTALRVAANARRATLRRPVADAQSHELANTRQACPEHAQSVREARQLLDELLERMPDELRRVLVLAEIEQLEVTEIAALEAIALGTAASRLRRARAVFRELLKRASARNPFAEGA